MSRPVRRNRLVELHQNGRRAQFRARHQALKRVAQPDDVGGVVAFLASDEARWISGDTVRVDGGSKL